jgi:uncharacterized membrane protein
MGLSPSINSDPLRSWPWWRWVFTGLIALALALSGYLSWHSLVGGPVIGCGSGHPCEQVLSSRWSAIGGVLPVSGLAAGAYLAMLVASLSIGPATPAPVRRLAWGALLVLVGAAAGSAVWFTIVQKWLIGAFCLHCMATHVIGLLLAALVLWRAPVLRPLSSVLVGLVLAGILAACQVGFAPRAVYRGGESQDSLPALDAGAVPLVGAPDAPYVVTLLFDYKCPHCQQMHFLLDEAIRRYDNKLAFALCPTPLDRQCNPYILRDVEEYKGSGELAKVGLAVWVAQREAFDAFNRWMYSLESGDRWRPRSLDAARAKAVELVGQAQFEAARADPWIDRYLTTCLRIYRATLQSGNGGVPKLIFGSRWAIPQPVDGDDLVRILQAGLAVPMP